MTQTKKSSKNSHHISNWTQWMLGVFAQLNICFFIRMDNWLLYEFYQRKFRHINRMITNIQHILSGLMCRLGQNVVLLFMDLELTLCNHLILQMFWLWCVIIQQIGNFLSISPTMLFSLLTNVFELLQPSNAVLLMKAVSQITGQIYTCSQINRNCFSSLDFCHNLSNCFQTSHQSLNSIRRHV